LTLADAERIAAKGKPWTFRLEFIGANATNASGVSDKYWYATGRAVNEAIEIGWGANGTAPQHQLIDWDELRKRVAEKLGKGYTYTNTPYMRMTPASIAKLGGPTRASGQGSLMPMGTNLPTTTLPPVVKAGTRVSVAPGVTVKAVSAAPVLPTTGPVTRCAALLALGDPWALANHLKVVRQGTTVIGYAAIDDNGNELLRFAPQGGIDFARDYGLDIDFKG